MKNLLNITWDILIYDLPNFMKNLWFFRKILWNFKPWDYSYNIMAFRRSLELTLKSIEKYSNEETQSKLKKCSKMKRAIDIMKNIENDNYIEIAENKLDKKVSTSIFDFKKCNNKIGDVIYKLIDNETPEEKKVNEDIFSLARVIEENEWEELWGIMKGQNIKNCSEDEWNEAFDGSGLNEWWF